MNKELEALNYLVNLAVVGNKENNREKVFTSEEIIFQAIKQAQKQEKLLELYRKLDDCIVAPAGHYVCRYTDDEKYARIRKQIKELENNDK